MKSNTWTIIKKEFARFFGDRQLVFTSVIMPGLLIYLIYSFMGNGIGNMITSGADEEVTVCVENLPASMESILGAADAGMTLEKASGDVRGMVDELEDKEVNKVLLRFPAAFDDSVAAYSPQSGRPAPNVEIYYNSTNNASARVYAMLSAALTAYEDAMSNRFDVNRADEEGQQFDVAPPDAIGAMIWSKILPMLIIMMLFSGTMAIAPSAIAGEKERGTIATLLVTPMRRNELAMGKIASLSTIALLSGISSFIGIALSLPKMIQQPDSAAEVGMHPDAAGDIFAFHYAASDYVALLLVILASVLIMASVVSLLSALAKDVKNAGTMITPFMLVIMLAGLLPMFQTGTSQNLAVYLIPFYNSIEVMTAVFAHELSWTTLAVTLGSNVVYAGMAVWGLTRMFNSEKIMFNA